MTTSSRNDSRTRSCQSTGLPGLSIPGGAGPPGPTEGTALIPVRGVPGVFIANNILRIVRLYEDSIINFYHTIIHLFFLLYTALISELTLSYIKFSSKIRAHDEGLNRTFSSMLAYSIHFVHSGGGGCAVR